MSPENYKHSPVLCQELSQILAIRPEGVYVDGTFGRGGHSRLILEKLNKNGKLYAFDRDAEAQQAAQADEFFSGNDNFIFLKAPFAEMANALRSIGVGTVDGILLDLGISSPQIDNPERGFSYRFDGPLDMRMDRSQAWSASDWIASASEEAIAKVIKDFGEERYAKQIAKEIVQTREDNPLKTTSDLAKLVERVVPRNKKDPLQHPAARTFQAIRIFINDEFGQLIKALNEAGSILKAGGVLAAITFHSLEDRIVKRFFNECANPHQNIDSRLPLRADQLPTPLFDKARRIFPSELEQQANPRARSACLRYATRTSAPWRPWEET